MQQYSVSALGFIIWLKMVQRKTGLLFFTSEVCSHHASLVLQMQTTEAHPFLPSPYTHHPMKARATVLQNYIGTLDYLFISYSSLHCINFPLTNQTFLLERLLDYFFQINVFRATQIHMGDSCCTSQGQKGDYLLLPGGFKCVPTSQCCYLGYSRGKKKNIYGRDCKDLNYSLGCWCSDVTLFYVANYNTAYLNRAERCLFLISPLFPARCSCRLPVQSVCRGEVNSQLQLKEDIIVVSRLHYSSRRIDYF